MCGRMALGLLVHPAPRPSGPRAPINWSSSICCVSFTCCATCVCMVHTHKYMGRECMRLYKRERDRLWDNRAHTRTPGSCLHILYRRQHILHVTCTHTHLCQLLARGVPAQQLLLLLLALRLGVLLSGAARVLEPRDPPRTAIAL